MQRFFFTYGTEGHPFHGGWTEVQAPDIKTAQEIFRAYHPDKEPGLLNCGGVYTLEAFKKTSMAGEKGNFGSQCHEIIAMVHYIFEESGNIRRTEQ